MTKYILYAALAALAALGVMYFLSSSEVARLKLEASELRTKHAQEIATKLSNQSSAHADQIKRERTAAMLRTAFDRDTAKLARQEADHANTVARSLVVVINRMLDHARAEFGAVPASAGGPAASGPATTGTALEPVHEYTDAQTAIEDYSRWAETGWGRVRSIQAVQKAGCTAP